MPKLVIPRMSGWVVIVLILLGMVWWTAPQQLTVVMYKVSLVTIAACLTYWIDKSLFARMSDRLENGMLRDVVSAARVVSRAIIFLGTMLGVTLGV